MAAGTYSVTATDANGCTTSQTVTITEPTLLTSTSSSTDVTCNGAADGTATIIVSGGTAPYTYLWSDGQTTATATGLAAGTYSVTATDANGCTTSQTVTITEPTLLSSTSSSTDVTCNGAADGTATIIVSGGTAPYTYLWSDGQTTATATGLAAGTYSVTATDANGCTTSQTVTISEPGAITNIMSSTDVTCNTFGDGTATITVSGGTAPYTYLWSDGQTTATATGLVPGTYTVTATDANGCTTSGTVTITEPLELHGIGTSTDVTCNGACDGTATVNATGGTMPFTYLWSNGATTASVNGLCAGSYSVTVTDANGCVATASVVINEPPALALTVTATDVLCMGSSTGTATATVTGGTPPYSYSWDNGQTTDIATSLAEGMHIVTVTDANGCTIVDTATVNGSVIDCCFLIVPGTIGLDQSNCGAFDPNIITSISPGVSGYGANVEYLWLERSASTGNVFVPTGVTTEFLDPPFTTETTEYIRCARNEGCITYPAETNIVTITVYDTPQATINSMDASCNGQSDGWATVNVTHGTAPFTYLWSNGQTTDSISGLSAGTYTVTVTDVNGCLVTAAVTITEPGVLMPFATGTDALCYNECNGIGNVEVTGGTAPYTYLWSNGDTTATADSLCAGIYYTVTVTDANNCTGVDSIMIGEPAEIQVQFNVDYILGTIEAIPSNGVAPYTYSWSNGDVTATATTGFVSGWYTVTVTDANGCSYTDSLEYIDGGGMINNVTVNVAPNPFINNTVMTLNSHIGTNIFVEVFDAHGNIVQYVYDGYLEPGVDLYLSVQGDRLEPGMYLCRVMAADGSSLTKMIVLID